MNVLNLTVIKNPARMGVEFYLSERNLDGSIAIGEPVKMVVDNNPAVYSPPTFFMDNISLQNFIDELWNSGLRPSGLNDAQLTAQGRHLEDMRKIAFMFLEKDRE